MTSSSSVKSEANSQTAFAPIGRTASRGVYELRITLFRHFRCHCSGSSNDDLARRSKSKSARSRFPRSFRSSRIHRARYSSLKSFRSSRISRDIDRAAAVANPTPYRNAPRIPRRPVAPNMGKMRDIGGRVEVGNGLEVYAAIGPVRADNRFNSRTLYRLRLTIIAIPDEEETGSAIDRGKRGRRIVRMLHDRSKDTDTIASHGRKLMV